MTKIDCLFEFKCDKQWEQLDDIELKDLPVGDCLGEIRFCTDCKKNVYKIKTVSELNEARTKNYCVAITEPLMKILEFSKTKRQSNFSRKDITAATTGVLRRKNKNV
jgi:hypothetical protein